MEGDGLKSAVQRRADRAQWRVGMRHFQSLGCRDGGTILRYQP